MRDAEAVPDVVDPSPFIEERLKVLAAEYEPRLREIDEANAISSWRDADSQVADSVDEKLQDVHRQVEIGRVELRHARTGSDYTNSPGGAVGGGYFSLSDASHLVGTACGFTLAPPIDIALPTTTSPG